VIRRRLEHYRSADQQLGNLAVYSHVTDNGNRVKRLWRHFPI